MTHTYRSCIAVLLCIFTFSLAQAGEPTLKDNKNVFSISGTNVPDSVMKVMEFCTDVWSQYISTTVPIQVSVSWQELKSNVNAYAKPTNYYSLDGIYYPAALAEKLKGKNLNGNNADIEVVINKTLKWYLDPNQIPTSLAKSQYDLTTTLIHELAHGLGYIGNITSDNLETTDFPSPTIFDMWVSDSTGTLLVSKTENSFSLNNNQLTSDSLFWEGRYSKAYCGEKLELYAPKTFNSGSTVYHLNEEKYPTGCGYELMTPVLRQTEIFREPDFATISMLADLGWNDYFISHKVPQNSEDLSQKSIISFAVNDTLINQEAQTVLYSFDNGKHIVNLPATFNSETNQFEAEIPALPFDHTVSYAIRSITKNNDTIYSPVNYPASSHTFFIGDDTEAPIIEHTPINNVSTDAIDIPITATISDNFGIDSAYIAFYINSNDKQISKSKITINNDEAEGIIQLSAINMIFQVGDIVSYNIIAVDKAGNTTKFFEDKFQQIVFEEPQEPIRYFISNFDEDDAQSNFLLDKFSIKKENGFASKALHTAHPYAYSGIDGKYNQYTATLKKPIIIATNPAIMTFDEVVLVEPGKAGIEFGSFGFWDYVIVEGSKDINAETWYALGKIGWDSQLSNAWKTRYYSSTKNDGNNDNSLAVGDSTLFKNHKINLLENKYFRAGDTVFVRFRLQSDATNYAWGWAIDNLKIQERIALPVPYIVNDGGIYPNPCQNTLYCTRNDVKSCKIYNQNGILVTETNQSPIQVETLSPGMYFILIMYENGEKETKSFIKK